MKKLTALVMTVALLAPLAASAESSDDVIMNLMRSLNGSSASEVTSAATSAPVIARPPASITKAPTPSDVVLQPLHLFNVDGNAPKQDPQIETLQQVLAGILSQYAALSASSSVPTHEYASTTATTTPTTPAPVKASFRRDISVGSRGDDVRLLQNILIARGFLYGDATGYFGILTKTAVIAFQTDAGLPPVGTVGSRTRAILNATPVPVPAPKPVVPPHTFGSSAAQPTLSSSLEIPVSASTTDATSSSATTTPRSDSSAGSSAGAVGVFMSILPSEAQVGDMVSVTWLSQNADHCIASDGWGGPKPTLGAAKIGPLKFSLNLVLTCSGAGGEASTTALVVVGGEQ